MQRKDLVMEQRLHQGEKWSSMSIICELKIDFIIILLLIYNIRNHTIYLVTTEWWLLMETTLLH